MKQLLSKPLHLTIIVILLIVGGFYLYSDKQKQRYDAEAIAYLQRALTDISAWDSAALRRQLAPEASAAATEQQMEALLQRYRGLGAFKSLDDPQFGRVTAALSLFSGNTLLSYSSQARFRHGTAHVTATLILRDGRFQLYNFNLGNPDIAAAP
jgi:hypothetical protein